jgi:hypothetical protein
MDRKARKRNPKTAQRIESEKEHRYNQREHHAHQLDKKYANKKRRYDQRASNEDFDE